MLPYSDLIVKLYNANKFGGMKLGLQNSLKLQELLDFPDRTFKTIHVAGTNGKGSVSKKIAHALQSAGYRAGLYTSPHISCFRERIRINGKMIPEDKVRSLLSFIFELIESENIPATFFEITTFLALHYFSQEKVEVAVLETGLGGRLDATNVVNPILSIITSISLDHTDILGMTCEEIAIEKGGIIKKATPVIIGPRVPFASIQAIADQMESPCFQVNCATPLFEEENREVARAALKHLERSFLLPQDAVEKGLQGRQPCRFERIMDKIPIILDVAHNPDGLEHLFQMCRHHFPAKPIRILFGLSKSKDIESCLKLIAQECSYFHLVAAMNGRGLAVSELYRSLKNKTSDANRIMAHFSISEAVNDARNEAIENQELLLICGSFFIMSEVRNALGIQEQCDMIDLNERSLRVL